MSSPTEPVALDDRDLMLMLEAIDAVLGLERVTRDLPGAQKLQPETERVFMELRAKIRSMIRGTL